MDDLDNIAAYTFELPDHLVAATPSAERGASRLLVVPPCGDLSDATFGSIRDLLAAGDLLVLNDARVVAARVHARRSSGGQVEVFLLGTSAEGCWDAAPDGEPQLAVAMTRSSKRLHAGERLLVVDGVAIEVLEPQHDGGPARIAIHGCDVATLADRAGEMPLPPYIVQRRRQLGVAVQSDADRERYQTVYAGAAGAVAAPTAGLHFTEALLHELHARGVQIAKLTLHVGAGTFRPVTTDRLSTHPMHEERYVIPEDLAARWAETRRAGRRVVAVGTTVVRALESSMRDGSLTAGPGATRLLIRPGYRFSAIDAMITNFHLPRSTLLALVSAFAGHARIREAYEHAIASSYRFYSYGDAMWLEHNPGAAL